MKTPEENDIYNLFKARLTNPEKDLFSDDSWEKMEELLDKKPVRRSPVILLYRISAGMAAALLLFAGFYFLRPVTPHPNIARSSKDILKPVPGEETNALAQQPKASAIHQTERLHTDFFTLLPKQSLKTHHLGLAQPQPKAITRDILRIDSIISANPELAVVDSKKIFADTTFTLAETLPATGSVKDVNPVAGFKKLRGRVGGFSRQLTLSVLAAPDINNANKIGNGGQVGSNFGMQFSLQLFKRISISSGAFYAIKPYQTGSAYYKPQTPNWWASRFGSTGKPDQVVANCKVLDIPLNIDYMLFNKAGNKLAVGSGLSSYFMLSEAYHFNFADPAVKAPDFEINNRNQHVLGLINLNATYERKVNSRFGIVVQPYLKLPVSQIGFGQVNLRSTGVAAGLSWNINSPKIK